MSAAASSLHRMGRDTSFLLSISCLREFHSSFLTFIQFLFVAGQTLPQQLTFKHEVKQVGSDGEARIVIERSWLPRLKTRQVPLKRWALQVCLIPPTSKI